MGDLDTLERPMSVLKDARSQQFKKQGSKGFDKRRDSMDVNEINVNYKNEITNNNKYCSGENLKGFTFTRRRSLIVDGRIETFDRKDKRLHSQRPSNAVLSQYKFNIYGPNARRSSGHMSNDLDPSPKLVPKALYGVWKNLQDEKDSMVA